MTKSIMGARAAIVGVWLAAAGMAHAQGQTAISGNSWVAIGLIVGVVLLILLLISGVLGVTRRDTSDDDDAGVGVLEGIDEDDDKPRKRR